MSIRDIIEKWHHVATNYAQHGYTAAVHARDFEEMRDDFASALEELSLMEAVCEAAATYEEILDRYGSAALLTAAAGHRLFVARAALQAYRKKRGL